MEKSTFLENMDKFCGSTFWNSSLTWYTSHPDFTSCFKKTVLKWIPCLILWMFAGLDIYFIMNSTRKKIRSTWINVSKFFVNISLVFLVVIDALIKINRSPDTLYDVDVYSPIIETISLILAVALAYYNKEYGMQTSGLLFIFWLLMGICGIPQFRTEITKTYGMQKEELNEPYQLLCLISYLLIVLMFILNCLADKPSNLSKYLSKKRKCPEETASFLSKQFFSWFDSFAIKSIRKTLETDDLWELSEKDASGYIVPIFEQHWQNTFHKLRRKSKDQVSFLPALFKTFGVPFIFGTMFKIAQDLLTFASPQILSLLITFVKAKQEIWKGVLYAVLLFSVSMIQTVLWQKHLNDMLVIGMKIRAVLIASIYKKTLKLSSTARRGTNAGEIVNLMAVDAQRFMDLTTSINTIWSAPLQIILAFYFLWHEMGPSILTGLAVMIILIPINGYIAHHTKILQTKQMKNKDHRVKMINEILNGIKLLKLYAWEPCFEAQVVDVRKKEIGVLKKSAYLTASTSFILSCTPFLVSLATFATYVLVDENNILDANKAFVSISLFNIIRVPLNQLPQLISSLIQTNVSMKRLNNFLNADELDPDNVVHQANRDYPISIKNGTFSWDKDDILKNINMKVESRTLITVVGTFGSGKSSLISALLGEMIKKNGTVNVYGDVALVSQQAWIQNSTLKNNILFENPFNEDFYNKVIQACALMPDLELLPAGDMTEIGEKGINLSGGQKQRVSLARAVYADADIYLLDDPLSAVDSHVGKHIFERVIGPNGLLRNKTRLFVTHGITFLPHSNQILVVKNGEISESGSYQELMDSKGAFAEFLLHHSYESSGEHEVVNRKPSGEVDSKTEGKGNLSTNSITKDGSNKSKEDPNKNGQTLIKKEKAETGNVRWTVYKHYMDSIGYTLILSTLFLYFLYQVFSVGSNVWLGLWADDTEVYRDTHKRYMYIEVYGALGIFQVITVIFANLMFTKATLNAATTLHNLLLYNIMRIPMAFFDVTPIGRILARFSSDINTIDTVLPSLLQGVLSTFVQVIGTLVVISYSTPWFLSVVLPIFLGYYTIQRVCVAITRQIKRLESTSRSPIYSHFSETISGVHVIRAYSQEERFSMESQNRVDTNNICYYCGIKGFRWMAIKLEIMGNLIILFTALFAIISKVSAAGLVGLSITYAIEVTQNLKSFVRVVSNVESSIVAVERIKEYEEEPREAPWSLPNEKLNKNWPQNAKIVFEQYCIRYRPGLELVLKNLNLSIDSGEKVGIVGRTGSGKSSLTLSLFRMLEAAEGKILVDNVNIADIGLHTLRSRLTIIPQDPVLFAGTLRMNLDPFKQHNDDNIWKSLEHAHLKDFARGLPAGLQHEIAESGQNLSVGQRQLICLARALLRKTNILILDEATAAIDLETDEIIQKIIRNEFKECTVLTIAHRLNTILDYDRIIVLEKGQIREFDTPVNLMRNQNSLFSGMCKDAGVHRHIE